MKPIQNEETLVKRAKQHDEKALTQLLSFYQTYLYQIAYLYCKNQEQALDAVSECVTKVYLNLPKLKEPKYFKTWMTRILINEVLDDIKKRKHLISYDRLRDAGYEAEYAEDTITQEERLDLYRALDSLKPDYKKVLILKYFQDFSIKEISDLMDMSESSIKVLLHRGRKKLRHILSEEMAYEI